METAKVALRQRGPLRNASSILIVVIIAQCLASSFASLRAGGSSLVFYDRETAYAFNPEFNTQTSQGLITIEFWANIFSGAYLQWYAVSYNTPQDAADNFLVTKFSATIFGCVADFDFASLNDGSEFGWHHYAYTFNIDTRRITHYRDGEIVKGGEVELTCETPAAWENGGTLVIGQEQDGALSDFDMTQAFIGQLDELRIWNVARAQEQIRATMYTTLQGNEPGLQAYWKFDEGQGLTAADTVGSNDLTLAFPTAEELETKGYTHIPPGKGGPAWGPGCPFLTSDGAVPVRATVAPGEEVTIDLTSRDDGGTVTPVMITTLPLHGILFQEADGQLGAQITTVDSVVTGDKVRYLAPPTFDATWEDEFTFAFPEAPANRRTVMLRQKIAPVAYMRHLKDEKEDTTILVDIGGYSDQGANQVFEITHVPENGLLYTAKGNLEPDELITEAGKKTRGIIVFIPSSNAYGDAYATIRYRYVDGTMVSDEAEVVIDVKPVDDPPLAGGALYATVYDGSLAAELALADTVQAAALDVPVRAIELQLALDASAAEPCTAVSLLSTQLDRQLDLRVARRAADSVPVLFLAARSGDSASTYETACRVSQSSLQFIAVAFHGTQATLLCEGAETSIVLPTEMYNFSPDRILVGGSYESVAPYEAATFFRGRMDELRLWTVDRSSHLASDIAKKFHDPAPGLISLSMDEGAGATATSATGTHLLRSPDGRALLWIVSDGATFADSGTAEDNAIELVLDATDVENTYATIPVISKLPERGTLYQVEEDGSRGAPIEVEFKSWVGYEPLEQWPVEVLGYSSYYGGSSTYSPQNLLGEPHEPCMEQLSDCPQGWCPASSSADGGEWLELRFATRVHPLMVEVFEVLQPGATSRVLAQRADSNEWVALYSGAVRKCNVDVNEHTEPVIFIPELCQTPFLTDRVRVELDTEACAGWNELAGVRLVGPTLVKDGIVLNGQKRVVYVPDANFNGDDSFEYRVVDCGFDMRRATEPFRRSLTVSAVNDQPIAEDLTLDGIPQSVGTEILLAVSDVDGDALTFTIVSLPTKGSLTDPTGDGQQIMGAPVQVGSRNVLYTPNAGLCGNDFDSFTYQVSDGTLNSQTRTVTIASVVCDECPEGFYKDPAGDGGCSKCPAGTYRSANLSDRKCLQCSPGSYQESDGAAACDSCPDFATNFLPVIFESLVTSGEATSVLDAFDTSSRDKCKCAEGYFGAALTNAGCTACPTGGRCCVEADNGRCEWGGLHPRPLPGFFTSDSNQDIMVRCFPSEACTGADANGDPQCAATYTGYRCGKCADNSYRLGDQCLACPSSPRALFAIAALFAIMIVFVTLYVSALGIRLSSMIIFTNVVQVVALYQSYELSWPTTLIDVMNAASLLNFNLEIFAPECSVGNAAGNYFTSLVLWLVIPIAFGGILCVLFFAFQAIGARMAPSGDAGIMKGAWRSLFTGAREERVSKFVNAFVMFLGVAYTSLCSKSLEMFVCKRAEDGSQVLLASPDVDCYVGEHSDSVWMAYLGLLLYGIGIPVALVVLMVRNKTRLQDPQFRMRYGSVFKGYKHEWYYWDAIAMFRKFLILFGTVVFNTTTMYQTMFGLVVLFVYLLMEVHGRPFKIKAVNIVQTIGDITLFITLLSGVFFSTGRLDEGWSGASDFLTYILVALVITTWVAALATVVIELRVHLRALKYAADTATTKPTPKDGAIVQVRDM